MNVLNRGLALLLASVSVACASNAALVRPKEDTAGSAVGERTCDPKTVAGDTEPFAVDWSDANRASLESAMQKGIAVVKYSCEGVEVLKGCSVAGEYAYRGISKKTKVIKMKDGGSIAANLGAPHLPASVEAELKQGKSLDLAYALVGNDSTTVQDVTHDMLKGRCDGATHFVYETSVGAFALGTSASGEMKAAADVFGYGKASQSANSEKSSNTTDGDLTACQSASDAAKSKAEGCKAVVRVTLFSIKAGSPQSKPEVASKDARTCKPGFVYEDEACVKESEVKSPVCAIGDLDGCKVACSAGSVASCGRFAQVIISRFTDKDYSFAKKEDAMRPLLQGLDGALVAACDQGEGAACSVAAHAQLLTKGSDFAPEGAVVPSFVALNEKGCRLGDTVSCGWVIMTYGYGFFAKEKGTFAIPVDVNKLTELGTLGCDRGNAVACFLMSSEYVNSAKRLSLTPVEGAKRAIPFLRRACTGGIGVACGLLGAMLTSQEECLSGMKALRPALKATGAGNNWTDTEDSCPQFATLLDPKAAKELFEIGCKRGDSYSCSKK